VTVRLTAERARRLAVAAQGLGGDRPRGRVDVRHVRRVLSRLGAVQIDSVNVVARAHELTLFARLGPYDPGAFRRLVEERREAVEYWAHVASFVPVETWPLFRHRMEAEHPWRAITRIRDARPGYIESVLDEVRARGPLTASQLTDPGERRSGPWWDWDTGKAVLEWLFTIGEVTVAGRVNGFTRVYDVPERVVPARYLEAPAVPAAEAHVELAARALRAMGVATARDLADYYRMPVKDGRAAAAALVAAGRAVPAEVDGWREPALLDPEATVPRQVKGRALLCPFDSLVWYRERAERIFGFRYRIEIYVPRPQRQYGYYVFPFLLGDRLVARADIKADRQAGVLRVPGAFGEDGIDRRRVADELAAELETMAGWLGLGGIEVGRRGDLADAVRSAAG